MYRLTTLDDPDLAEGPSLWSDPWMRAGLIHPVFFVTPWLILCFLLASLPGSESGYVAWGLWIVPLSAFASFIATAVMAPPRTWSGPRRLLLLGLGLLASTTAGVLGFLAWFAIAKIACHGGYECPL